jgi:hypothetical protein
LVAGTRFIRYKQLEGAEDFGGEGFAADGLVVCVVGGGGCVAVEGPGLLVCKGADFGEDASEVRVVG